MKERRNTLGALPVATSLDETRYEVLEAPFGEILIVGSPLALEEVRFPVKGRTHRRDPLWRRGGAVVTEARRQLAEYFRGKRRDFDLPLAPRGTPFEMRVWAALRKVRYGATVSYGDLARRIGKPSAARAVGAAMGRNPLPIVIPCHRVIGADGSLTGFGGGLTIKEALLALEGRGAPASPR
jgi:methylated-DNA-[protein]-cysteine S-methyltransferase